ncbi:MAG TPA: GNAT family N-acetyltransferase [Thermoanaerobaculia bacterium]|jgi:ribosomal protein S18 acetylase RimI-like enzyme
MSSLLTRALHDADFEAVHAAFVEAFSDYVIKLSPTREQLAEMLTRRGYVPDASVGIFDGQRLVAFTLNGIDGDAAYDSGTGVVPSHRRRGLARAMLEFLTPRLKERGCTRYVLEVIDANHAAAELYRSHRFVETRKLQCWSFESGGGEELAEGQIREEWCDVAPSWQNTTASIGRARDPHIVLGNDDGYAVLFPSNGDVPQLAVRPDARRAGLGTRLLRAASRKAGKPLRIINIDAGEEGIARFLTAAGAIKTVMQLEMIRTL